MNALMRENTNGNIDVSVAGAPVHLLGRYGVKGSSDSKFQRVDTRLKTIGIMAIVYDGESSYFCVVEELSAKGLRLGKILPDFDESSDQCTATVLTPFDDLRVFLDSRWVKETNRGMYKTVGFQIDTPSHKWHDLASELESGAGNLAFMLSGED